MAKKKKTDPYTGTAQAQSIVRYGPEVSALAALLRDAEDRRDTMIRQAHATRQATVAQVEGALPAVAHAFAGAQKAVTPAFAGGGGIEASALQARLGEATAQAQSQLQARRVGAAEGEGAARVAALRDYASDRSKIQQRALDLSREQGAFISSTIGDMAAADAKAQNDANALNARLTQSERASLRSAGIDPDTGKPIPLGPIDPNAPKNQPKGQSGSGKPNAGKGWASQAQQSSASDEIQRLLKEATENKAAGESRASTADFLLSGAGTSKKPVYKTVEVKNAAGAVTGHKQVRVLNPDGTPKTIDVPGFDAAKSQLLASAALDMAYDGHLSRRNQKLLHARGIQLKPLGLVTYQEWLRKNRRTRAQAQNPHATGQAPTVAPGNVHGHI